jgi:Protein of unknown function (DUF4199)
MKKIVLTFGLISGGILAAMTALMVPMCMGRTIDFDHAEVIGYTVMVLSFLLVFFGIRSYRENMGGGAITFGKAFQARFKELYKNPFVNAGMTFMEVFPVSLVVTLVSAAILRRKTPRATPAAVVAAAS